jgi:hypothetical protein
LRVAELLEHHASVERFTFEQVELHWAHRETIPLLNNALVSTWNVGACFACTKCLLRSVWRTCPSCGGDTIDLRTTTLESTWSAWPAFAQGLALYSWKAPRGLKVIRWLSALVTVGATLAPVFGPWLHNGKPPALGEAGLGLLVGLVFAWPVYTFFCLYLLLFAHVLRGLSALTNLASEISPIGTLRFSVLAKLTRFLSRPLIPQLELWSSSALDGPTERATLTEPLIVNFVRDGWGFMERFDVHLEKPARVKLESGETRELEIHHGGLESASLGVRTEESTLPGWLEAPNRPGLRFKREIPAGTRVVVTRAREGLDDARVHIRFLS